jgi:hypothetical protein
MGHLDAPNEFAGRHRARFLTAAIRREGPEECRPLASLPRALLPGGVRLAAYLPGRTGCGTSGDGPHTSMSTLRARVRSSLSTRCTSSSLLQAAQAARSANS